MSEPVPFTGTVYNFTLQWLDNGADKFFGCPMPVTTDEEAVALGVFIRDNCVVGPNVSILKVFTSLLQTEITLPPPESPPEP